MAGEDVLLRIGGDLTALEAALARAAKLAGDVPIVSIVPAKALNDVSKYTQSLQGAVDVSRVLTAANVEAAKSFDRMASSSLTVLGKGSTENVDLFLRQIRQLNKEVIDLGAALRSSGATPELEQRLIATTQAMAGLSTTQQLLPREIRAIQDANRTLIDSSKDVSSQIQKEASFHKSASDQAVQNTQRRAKEEKAFWDEEGRRSALAVKRSEEQAAAFERSAVVQYNQQKKLQEQMAALQALPQTPAVTKQIDATAASLNALTKQAEIAKLPFKQLTDQNQALIKSFEAGAQTSSIFGQGLTGMISRVVAVGLAFKGLTIVLNTIASLSDVDRTLSLIAGTVNTLDERQRVLAESSRMIFDVMKQTGRSADEAGQLVIALQRAVGGNAEMLNALYIPALALTVQKETDLAQTVTLLIGLYNTYGNTIAGATTTQEQYLRISDQVVTAANASSIGIGNLVTALTYVGNSAAQAGAPLQDMLAMLSLMIEKNVQASTAGTGLRRVFLDVRFEAARVAEAFKVATDAANPQPYVLLTTILEKLAAEWRATGKFSAETTAAFKKAFPDIQELAAFTVLADVFTKVGERAKFIERNIGASQKILDEFKKSIGAAGTALQSELIQMLDLAAAALTGEESVPGKLENLSTIVYGLVDALAALRTMLGDVRGSLLSGGLLGVDPFTASMKRLEEQAKATSPALKALREAQQASPQSFTRLNVEPLPENTPRPPIFPPGTEIEIPVKLRLPVDVQASAASELAKIQDILDKSFRETQDTNVALPASERLKLLQKQVEVAQKGIAEYQASASQGIVLGPESYKSLEKLANQVNSAQVAMARLRQESERVGVKASKVELKAEFLEGHTVDSIIEEGLKAFRDKDLTLTYRLELAEGALAKAEAEMERVRAIALREGVPKAGPQLKAAVGEVAQLTGEVNRLQAEQLKVYTAEVEHQVTAQNKMAEALGRVEEAWIESGKALQSSTEYSRTLEQINKETLAAFAEAGKAFMDENGVFGGIYDPVAYAAAVDKIYKTGENKHQAYLNGLVERDKEAVDQLANTLREAAIPEGEAALLSVRNYVQSFQLTLDKTADGIRFLAKEQEELARNTGNFIDKLTGAERAERELRAMAVGMNLVGVEAVVATQAILQFGKSIEELESGDWIEKRIAESIRRAAAAAEAQRRLSLGEGLAGAGLSDFTTKILNTNDALDKQLSKLSSNTTILATYNNRVRDAAIAQAQWDQEVAKFSGNTLGYLAARLREADAAMTPLLESLGDGLVNVLQAGERAVSDFFFNAFLGNIDTATQAFEEFGRAILRELSNVLASAVVKDFLSLLTGKGLSGDGIVGLIGGIIGAIGGIAGAGSGEGKWVEGSTGLLELASDTKGGAGGSGGGTGDSVASALGTLGTVYSAAAELGSLTGLYTLPKLTTLAAQGLTSVGTALGLLGPSAAASAAAISSMTGGVVGMTSAVGAFGPIAASSLQAVAAGSAFATPAASAAVSTTTAAAAGASGASLAGGLSTLGAALPAVILGLGMMLDAQSEADRLWREKEQARQAQAMTGDVAAGLEGLTLQNAVEGMRRTFLETLGGYAVYSAIQPKLLEERRQRGELTETEIPANVDTAGYLEYMKSIGELPRGLQEFQKTFEFTQSGILSSAESLMASLAKLGIEATTIWANKGKNAPKSGLFSDWEMWDKMVVAYADALEKLRGVVAAPIVPGEPGAPSVPKVIAPETIAQQNLLIKTAADVNVAFKTITDSMNLAQQAVVTFGTVTDDLPQTWLQFGSVLTDITHKSQDEITKLLDHIQDVLSFEQFVTTGGKGVARLEEVRGLSGSGDESAISAYFLALEDMGGSLNDTMIDLSTATSDQLDTYRRLISTAVEVNLGFRGMIDQLGVAQHAVVLFNGLIDGIPETWLGFGTVVTEITHSTQDEIDALLSHMNDVLSFEKFVVSVKKVTDSLGLASQATLEVVEGTYQLKLSLANLSGDAMLKQGDTVQLIADLITDISGATKEQLIYFRHIIIDGLTKALVEAPEKIVGIMDLEALKKPGETVEQAGERLGKTFTDLSAIMQRATLQADLAAGRTSELTEMIKAYDKAQVALLTAANPEELLAAASAVETLIPQVFGTMIDAVRELDAAIERIEVSMAGAVTEFLRFSVVTDTLNLSAAVSSTYAFILSLDTLAGRLATLPALIQVFIANATDAFNAVYFSSGAARAAGAPIASTGGSPADIQSAVAAGLSALAPLGPILSDIFTRSVGIQDPIERMSAINAYVGVVDTLYQEITSGISRAYAQAREDSQLLYQAEKDRIARTRTEGQKTFDEIQQGLQDQKTEGQKLSQKAIEEIREASEERLKGLQKEREAGQKASQKYLEGLREADELQREALQAQISALQETIQVSQEWEAAANRLRDTILDLTLSQSSAITNPQQRLALARAEFAGAQATYAASPTAESAERVAELGRMVIQALTEVFPRAGGNFETQSQQVLLVLQAIQDQARSRVGDQEAMTRNLVAMQKSLEEIGKATAIEVKAIEDLTEEWLEGLDAQIEAEREHSEDQIKGIEKATEEYLEGIDRQIEANEVAMEEWLAGLVREEEALDASMKEWLSLLSAAEQQDIQDVKNGLAPLMEKAAIEMGKAAKEAEEQKIALQTIRDGITGGTPTDLFIAARTADMVNLQAALPSQIEKALADQVGAYLHVLLTSLGLAYAEGTPSVPHTTLAQVHKGEMIISAGDSDVLRRYGIKVVGGGEGGNTIEQNNFFNVSGVRDPEALVNALADRVVEKLRGSIGTDIIQRGNGRRW